jgi:hypothetical protein
MRASRSHPASYEVRRVGEGWFALLWCGSLLYLSAVHQPPTQATIPASSRSAGIMKDATLSTVNPSRRRHALDVGAAVPR